MKKKMLSVLAAVLFVFPGCAADAPAEIAAVYGDYVLTREMIGQYREGTAADAAQKSDAEIIETLIGTQILLEEAEALGLGATQAEIDERVQFLQENYAEYPEVAEVIDEFCAGAGMTIEEYWAVVRDEAHDSITLLKYKRHFRSEYCAENGLDPEALTDEQYDLVDAAYESYRAARLQDEADSIEWADKDLLA